MFSKKNTRTGNNINLGDANGIDQLRTDIGTSSIVGCQTESSITLSITTVGNSSCNFNYVQIVNSDEFEGSYDPLEERDLFKRPRRPLP